MSKRIAAEARRVRLLKKVNGNVARLKRLLGKTSDAEQLERLLDKTSDAKLLERLLDATRDAEQLERLLNNHHISDAVQLERLLDNARVQDAERLERLLVEQNGDQIEAFFRAEPYAFPRTQGEWDELALDPAIGRRSTHKTEAEREAALGLEARNAIPGPIERDPNPAGGDFIDGTGQVWDVKTFNSNYSPRKGGFTPEAAEKSMLKDLNRGENIILDTRNLSNQHMHELRNLVTQKGWEGRVEWWP
jgi:hypothetical protein